MVTLDRELVKKGLVFLSSPITALLFSIILSVFFYYASISYKTPSYFNSFPELIAKKADSNLKILYRNSEVSNIYFTTLVIWNDGKDFIDYNDFVKSKPTIFFSNDSVEFLSVSLDKKSRVDLKFDSEIIKNKVIVELSEDEALEEGDGASFNILYTKSSSKIEPEFILNSRIKGTKKGFVFKDITNFKKENSHYSIYFLWILIITLLLIRIVTLYLHNKPIVFRSVELIFILTLLGITIYLTIHQIFYSTNLYWIK
jgi:hypothetical protein